MNARNHSSPKHLHVLAPVPGGSIISMSPNVQKCDLYLCPAASMHTAAEKCVRSAELWCCAFKCLLYFFVLGTNPTNTHFSYSQRSQAATSKWNTAYFTITRIVFMLFTKSNPVSSMFSISSPRRAWPFNFSTCQNKQNKTACGCVLHFCTTLTNSYRLWTVVPHQSEYPGSQNTSWPHPNSCPLLEYEEDSVCWEGTSYVYNFCRNFWMPS